MLLTPGRKDGRGGTTKDTKTDDPDENEEPLMTPMNADEREVDSTNRLTPAARRAIAQLAPSKHDSGERGVLTPWFCRASP
jgi:hypothetical protein